MARQSSAVEVNKFNAGLITDASPLTAPDNSSLDENNMVLNIDGSRNRRLGLDFEADGDSITTNKSGSSFDNTAITTFKWDNAGGDPEKSLLVVQTGNQIKIFDLGILPLSDALISTQNFPSSSDGDRFSFAVVDGVLVIATGQKNIYSMTFSPPNIIVNYTYRLLVRDLFGVEDVSVTGADLTRGTEVQNRVTTLTDNHLYNLRNQSWGIPRIGSSAEIVSDPVEGFQNATPGTLYPSNADNVIAALYPDAGDPDNRTIDRFFAGDLYANPLGTTRSPLGYFVIDALDRGVSRLEKESENRLRYPELDALPVTTLSQDITPSGATAISEFAGRVFYAGFPGEVIDGDRYSPKMSSYVLFSKVVDNIADINLCYQEGDPTSKDNAEIIDTDGGFIRINEAYGIKALINLGNSLMVVASNGVWRLVGNNDSGFTATGYLVERITDRGCVSSDSIAVIDNSFMFWGDDAIYHLTTDQYGSWVCNNISFGRIQRFFDTISTESKKKVRGEYDSYERKVRWIINNRVSTENTLELVLDLQLQAFYKNTIEQFDNSDLPKVTNLYITNPYEISTDIDRYRREIGYLVVTSIDPVIEYGFAYYNNQDYRDWFSLDGVGVDAEAYVITSYISGSDFQRDKRVPYITVHSRRTETGFEQVGDDLVPINQSSILLQSRWDWSDSDRSGKWGREFQAYRYRRLYLPTDVNDDYDNGFSTIVTRNKLRGGGKVVSLRFRTEPYRNFHLYGWSMIFSVAENV